jgi:sarcosine oxidase subunit alpha
MTDQIELVVDGERLLVDEGSTIAAALLNAGITTYRSSVTGERRGPVCGMGICYECRVTVDGVSHQRACVRLVAPGMRVDTARGDVG